MYTKYFGFNEKPFTLTPNPRFIFLSKNHKEAFAHLLYGINNHYGFIELTGEIGTGKTTVLRTLLSQLQDEAYRTALIFSPCQTGVELLQCINNEFGIENTLQHANELLAELNRFLLSESTQGRTVVLVIDEAQNLQPEVLEQIRLISNLETENDKLIQIILAGQPELEQLLERPDLRQLNQRIAVRYKLRPMSMVETQLYIRQRMEIAGETGGVAFSELSIKLIYLATRGVPRMINILCDRALLIAYGNERRRISTATVLQGMREVLNRSLVTKSLWFITTLLISLLIVTILIIFTQKPDEQRRVLPLNQTDSTTSVGFDSKLKQEILSYDQNDTHTLLFNTFAELWQVRPLNLFTESLDVPDMFRRLAAKRNLRLTQINGTIDDALRFGLPFIIVTNVSGDIGEYCYAVTSERNESVTISPSLFDQSSISIKDLKTVSSGVFYIVWQNHGQIPDTLMKGEKRMEVKTLQRLLKQAGFYADAINGVYSAATISAVNRFQRSKNIAASDNLGELTLAVLSRYDTGHRIPMLKDGL